MARHAVGRIAFLVPLIAVLFGVNIGAPHLVENRHSCTVQNDNTCGSILQVFAKHSLDYSSSTTPAPLSETAVLVKKILADRNALPEGLESAIRLDREGDSQKSVVDVHVAPVRDFISSLVLREVEKLCRERWCDPNEADPDFGTTPLHLAEFWGSSELTEYLLSLGANPETFDSVGRQPRNMSFRAFSDNSKRAAKARLAPGAHRDERCEIPEVTIPLFPQLRSDEIETGEENLAAAEEWQKSAQAALSEVRRLVSEGEPVMVRNMLPWLQMTSGKPLEYPSSAAFVEAWGHRPVDVGSVPYAKNFQLHNARMTLKDYITATSAASCAESSNPETCAPDYVFQIDTEACGEGRDLMGRIVESALPSSGERPIICPAPSGLRGLESVHYYLGGRWSGAPFHFHSDAINLSVSGRKRWWMVTPRHAVWSRRHVREYAEEGKGGPQEVPMECVQRGGDLVYVPGEWGHGVINLEDDTFG